MYFLSKKKTKESLINVGSGIEKKIIDYAHYIMKYLNVELKIKFEKRNLNGTPRKLLDSKIAKKYGWKSKTKFSDGISLTINDYQKKLI